MEDAIVNRVANSGLVQIDLETWYVPGKRVGFDMAALLDQGLLREKVFRERLAATDLSPYQGAHVYVHCSQEAIVPLWSWMLLAGTLGQVAQTVVVGSLEDLERTLFQQVFDRLPWEDWRGAKMVVKGCGKYAIPEAVFADFTLRAQRVASSILFGEPCSTVPLFKKPKTH
jgi:hypothetical protein